MGGWDAWPDPVERLAAKAATGRVHAFKSLPELRGGAAAAAPHHHAGQGGRGRRQDHRRRCGRSSRRTTCSSTAATSTSGTPSGAPRSSRPTGLRFFGMGVSGGEEGARHGPSMMPGGDRDGYDDMAPILTKIAAQVEDGPCVTYMRPGRRRPLRQDGAQRDRVRRHAADRRGLRSPAQRRRPVATPSWPTRSTNGTGASCSRS